MEGIKYCKYSIFTCFDGWGSTYSFLCHRTGIIELSDESDLVKINLSNISNSQANAINKILMNSIYGYPGSYSKFTVKVLKHAVIAENSNLLINNRIDINVDTDFYFEGELEPYITISAPRIEHIDLPEDIDDDEGARLYFELNYGGN